MKVLIKTLFFFALFAIVTPASAAAPDHYTTTTLKPAHNKIKAGESLDVATIIGLAPHWHVYWSNPGDSGLPVAITWTLPEGFTMDEIQWPVPDKISYDILSNYGYYDRAALLQTLHAPATLPEGPIDLTAKVDLLVCNEICVPESATLSLRLNDPSTAPEDNTAIITSAQEKLPAPLTGTAYFTEEQKNLVLTITPEDQTLFANAAPEALEFFPLDWGILNHNEKPSVNIKDGTITLNHPRGGEPIAGKETLSGLLVIKGEIGQNKGYALSITPAQGIAQQSSSASPAPTPSAPAETAPAPTLSLYAALLLALSGGLILNLMPCVFPVLSMKALSLVKMSGKEIAHARLHGLSYTAGVILSFAAIGGALLALKSAGSIIGWGFQLQNPIIVGALAYLLFALGLNLMGFFEIGGRFGNIGSHLTKNSGLSGSFFTGVLATIVATPCTAPFMGAAMGFALLQPPALSLLIFAAMGFGLALPYLLLACIPAARHLLPRPGAWMHRFKQFLAFPMFASALWLVWVLAQQAGSTGLLLALMGMLCIAFCVWLSHLRGKGLSASIRRLAIVIFLILPILCLLGLAENKTPTFGEAFTTSKLDEALAGDAPTFVEMTAAWCITCKLNHATSLNTEDTKNLFAENKVTYLIGDWTNYNEEITKYLETFGRNGVPLYVYYPPRNGQTGKRPDPQILPQVLTPAIVQQTVSTPNE